MQLNNKKTLINNKVFKLVIVFAIVSVLNQIYEVLNSFHLINLFKTVDYIGLLFFIIQTIIIILVTINLSKCLIKAYPKSLKLIIVALIIWYLKIFLNVIIMIFKLINNESYLNSLFSITNQVAIILNLSLILVGLFIIIINKIPKIYLFIFLAVNQIVLSISKLLIKDNIIFDNIISLISMIIKLTIVVLILDVYRKLEIE